MDEFSALADQKYLGLQKIEAWAPDNRAWARFDLKAAQVSVLNEHLASSLAKVLQRAVTMFYFFFVCGWAQ